MSPLDTEQIIKYLILPSHVLTISLICGFALLLTKKLKRVAISMITTAGILYILFGTGPISVWLLSNLEYKYPALKSTDGLEAVEAIVVLAGYAEFNPDLPLSSGINSASAFRIVEAVRLFRIIPDAEILISGSGDVPKLMKDLMISMGLPAHKIVLESQSMHTDRSAINIKKMLASRTFVLVTSAGHMPRAVGAFKKIGMNPIPAPTHYMSTESFLATGYLPSPFYLHYSDLAVHEYLGILWYRLTNRL